MSSQEMDTKHFTILNDPLIREAVKVEDDGLSPMDAPDARRPPATIEPVPREALAPFLRQLAEEHERFVEHLTAFESALGAIREHGISRQASVAVRDFFEHFDAEVMAHQKREERHLFPVLEQALLDAGEHGTGPDRPTAVGLMEDDHSQALQLAAVVFNLLGMASRLPDEASRDMVLDAGIRQGEALVEQLRLHIFREDNILFPLAHRLIDASVLHALGS